jgi:hypothetical protein
MEVPPQRSIKAGLQPRAIRDRDQATLRFVREIGKCGSNCLETGRCGITAGVAARCAVWVIFSPGPLEPSGSGGCIQNSID